jgi:hypothetical protein
MNRMDYTILGNIGIGIGIWLYETKDIDAEEETLLQ